MDGAKPKARRTITTAKVLEKMTPTRDEIIIATGIELRDCEVRKWGWRSPPIFADCRQRG